MYTIILDSSNTSLSVGVANETEIIDYVSYEAWQQQSELMVDELNKMLVKFNIEKNEIESVIVSNGPGSYTGVRIALTIAKTIAVSLNVNVYTISSLHALKDAKNPSICVINARSGRSFVGVYQNEKCLLNDQVMTNEDLLAYIANNPHYSVCGDTKYLNISSVKTNIIKEMFSLKEFLPVSKDPLTIKPVYMRD